MNKIITDTKEYRVFVQRALNELTSDVKNRIPLVTDGIFGKKTFELASILQKKEGLSITNSLSNELLESKIHPYILRKFISQEDIVLKSKEYKIEPAIIFALMKQESMGAGFLPSGKVTILFERHHFFKRIREKRPKELNELTKLYPNILEAKPGGYYGKEKEWGRMQLAMSIDMVAAIESASWGLGQVMGFNWRLTDSKSPLDFYEKVQESELNQFDFLLGFIKNQPNLLKAFRAKEFTTIARLYNGPAFSKNNYDVKLRTYYESQPIQYKYV